MEAATCAPVPGNVGVRFGAVRATTRGLAAPLPAEDCAVQSMPDASPVKSHRAHTSWFVETFLLERFVDDYATFDPHFL